MLYSQFTLFGANLQIGFQPYLLVSTVSFMGQSQLPQRGRCVLPSGNRLLFFRYSFSHEQIYLLNIAFVTKRMGGELGEIPIKHLRSTKHYELFVPGLSYKTIANFL